MQVNWRTLFSGLRVEWRDRGRNTSKNNINICCPWCGKSDSSFHLRISEENGAYFCLRNSAHAGTMPQRVLIALGVKRYEATALLNEHIANATVTRSIVAPVDLSRWGRFSTLAREHLEYLTSRGFTDAERTARALDLRCDTAGEWARRILIPLFNDKGLRSWTGRAIDTERNPRYMARKAPDMPTLFAGQIADTTIIVEGPLDAAKINSAMLGNPSVRAIAVLGKQFTSERLLRLAQAKPSRVLDCLDSDASLSTALRHMSQLRAACTSSIVRRLRLPDDVKDAGEMLEPEIKYWLRSEQVL